MIFIEDGELFCASGWNEAQVVDSWNFYFYQNFDWIREYYEDDYYFDLINPVNSMRRIKEIINVLNEEIEDCNIEIKNIN